MGTAIIKLTWLAGQQMYTVWIYAIILLIAQYYRAFAFFGRFPPKLQGIVKILCTWRDILSIQSGRLRSSECVCYISRSGLVYVTGFH